MDTENGFVKNTGTRVGNTDLIGKPKWYRDSQVLRFSVLLGVAASFLSGCGGLLSQAVSGGTLKLTISEVATAARMIVPADIDMSVARYGVSGAGPDGASFGSVSTTELIFTRSGLAAGEWTITVTGYNSDEVAVGEGTVPVDIVSGADIAASVTVRPYTGTGRIIVTVRWPEGAVASPVIDASVERPDASIGEDLVFQNGGDGRSFVWTDNTAAAGYHTVYFTLLNGTEEIAGDSEVFRVVQGYDTVYTFDYTLADLARHVSKPTADLAAGIYDTPQTLNLACATPGASIYFTNNGSLPSAENGFLYTDPIALTSTQTIRALAVRTGWTASSVAYRSYVITGSIAVPRFVPAPGVYYDPIDVAIASPTADSSVKYTTDGTTVPTATDGIAYVGAVHIDADMIFLAIAKNADDSLVSDATIGAFRITGHLVAPTADLAFGTYDHEVDVVLSSTDVYDEIRYTLDGTDPDVSAYLVYNGPIAITKGSTLNARVYRADWDKSPLMSGTYSFQMAAPVCDPPTGLYLAEQNIVITTTTPNASIRYTVDASDPTTEFGIAYVDPATVNNSLTIKAIAYREGWLPASSAAVYELKAPVAVLSPTAGEYVISVEKPLLLTITNYRSDTVYLYETNGLTPTILSSFYDPLTGIEITAPAEIVIIAERAGWTDSDASTTHYGTAAIPASDSVLKTMSPTLDWPTDIDAATYNLQIAEIDDFASPTLDLSGISGSVYTVAPALTNGSSYYWRAQAVYEDLSTSAWYGAWNFSVDIQAILTINTDLSNPISVTLSGQTAKLGDGDTMTITAASNPALSTFAWYMDRQLINGETGTILTLSADTVSLGRHSILCVAESGSRYGSATASFIREESNDLVLPPRLVSPADAYVSSDRTPDFDWEDQGSAFAYRIQISATSDFTLPVVDDGIVTVSHYSPIADLSWGTTYWWRVASKGEPDGAWGSWSASRTVVIPVSLSSGFVRDATYKVLEGGAYSWELIEIQDGFVMYQDGTYKMWYGGANDNWYINYATSADGYSWTKYSSGPVLSPGGNVWDYYYVKFPYMMIDDGQYKMWYSGWYPAGIGLATSMDGINWTRAQADRVLTEGASGSFDSFQVYGASVQKIGTTYHMWYTGYDATTRAIGHATSSDGINWIKDAANPVLSAGTSWESAEINDASVMYEDGIFHMWYTGSDGANRRIGYAYSIDGSVWTRGNNNPVLDLGASGTEDDTDIWMPYVVKIGTEYRMYYNGTNNSGVGKIFVAHLNP